MMKTCSSAFERSGFALEGLPSTVDAALMRQESRLVFHALGLGDVQAEVQVAKSPALAEFDLLEHREGANAELFVARIVIAIDGRERFVAAVHERDADQFAVEQVAQFEGFTTTHDQKLAVPFEVDAVAIARQTAQFFVAIVQLDAAHIRDRIRDLDGQPRVAAFQSAALGAIGLELADLDANRLTRATTRTGRTVEKDALSAIAGVQALFELGALQQTSRNAQRHARDALRQIRTRLQSIVNDQLWRIPGQYPIVR